MKQKFLKPIVVFAALFGSLTASAQYVDLATGKSVNLVKNQANGILYNPDSQRPVYLYVNPATSDTFYGRTGARINGNIGKAANGTYYYRGDSGYVYSNGEYRLRTESDNYRKIFDRDGDVILKGENFKKKTEIDGDVKVKRGEAKTKMEGDGVLKVKNGDYKKKIDSEGNYLEKDATFKAKAKVDGSSKIKDDTRDYKAKIGADGDFKEKTPDAKGKIKKDGKVKIKTEDNKIKTEL